MWITTVLKKITMAQKLGKFPFNNKGFAGEDEAAAAAAAEAEATAAAAAASQSTGKFYEGFSPEIKNHPSIQKFDNAESLGKSYVELERKIGAKGVIIPAHGAGAEEVSSFHKALGRPDVSDGYQFQIPENMHKAVVSTAETQKDFKDVAFKHGLSADQAKGLHSWYLSKLSDAHTQQEASEKTARDEASTALRSKWGTMNDTNMALAQKVIAKFGGEKAQEFLDKGLGNDPAMIEFFATIGGKLSEDVLGPGGNSRFGAMNATEAQAKINETLANPNHPYQDSNSPLHAESVKEMTSLYQIVEGGGQ